MELQILLFGVLTLLSASSAELEIQYSGNNIVTPSFVFVGKENGDILRYLFTDPNHCDTFYQVGARVSFMTIHGEYLYGALTSGVMVRCDLHQANSCEDFNKFGVHMSTMSKGRGYILAGLHSGDLMKCDLYKSNSCSVVYAFGNDSKIISAIEFNDYIYVGLSTKELMRCSVAKNCSVMTTATGIISEFSIVNNHLFAVTWDRYLLKCTIQFCVRTFLPAPMQWPKSMVAFNGFLYVIRDKIIRCTWVDVLECMDYADHNAWSLTFTYSTRALQAKYRDEQTSCTWQSEAKCPPFVIYFDVDPRAKLEVYVKDGKLVNTRGSLIDTSIADEGHIGPAAIFAMGHDGRVFLSNVHKRGLLHSSSLLAGNPASGAGEIVVNKGVIEKIVACSEQYRADLKLNKQVTVSALAGLYGANLFGIVLFLTFS